MSKIIGTDSVLERYSNGSFYLGNIIADIQRKITGSQISIISHRGLRDDWNPGNLPIYKVYDLLPFSNKICSFTMTGKEFKIAAKILQSGEKKYYVLSGVKQIIVQKDTEVYLSNIKLFDGYKEEEIEDNKDYLISANNFLTNGGDEFAKIYRFYKPKNLRCDSLLERETCANYLKQIQILDVRKYMDEKNPVIRYINKTKNKYVIKRSILYK